MAQALLTPLISRVLQQFIRSSSEGDASTFRASLAGSSGIALQNLDLNLDSLLRGVPFIAVDRAFAKSLRVNIPWAALGSKPIEVTVSFAAPTAPPFSLPLDSHRPRLSSAGGARHCGDSDRPFTRHPGITVC
jgi:hypothetical protein